MRGGLIVAVTCKSEWKHGVGSRGRCTCTRVRRQASATSSTLNPPAVTNIPNNTAKMLPDEIIAQLTAEFQCRDQQIHYLAALYSVRTPIRLPGHCTNNYAGASPISTLSEHTWPYRDWQILDIALLLPSLPFTTHHHQRSRMHNRAASPGAHRRG